MINIFEVLPYVHNGFNSSTEILNQMHLKLNSSNYKELKATLMKYNCEPTIKNKRHGYLVDERGIRGTIAQNVIKSMRGEIL